MKFINNISNDITQLNKQINFESYKSDRKIFIFGAHIFTQFLFAFGLNNKHIVCILDNDKTKHGKRLTGTNLKVNSPAILKEYDKPCVIMKVGAYANEIRKNILEINSSAIVLE